MKCQPLFRRKFKMNGHAAKILQMVMLQRHCKHLFSQLFVLEGTDTFEKNFMPFSKRDNFCLPVCMSPWILKGSSLTGKYLLPSTQILSIQSQGANLSC